MKSNPIIWSVLALCFAFSFEVGAQRRPAKAKFGKICGNPKVTCRTGEMTFQPHEIPFEIPRGASVISESEPFYSIILKSVKLKGNLTCENAIAEEERLEIQKLFPNNKVFALKCSEPDDIYYTNIAADINFIAVYAGKTLTEANKFLKTVQQTGNYKGANVRKMQGQINGT